MKHIKNLLPILGALLVLAACQTLNPVPLPHDGEAAIPAPGEDEQISVRRGIAVNGFLRRPIDEMPDITNGKNNILPPPEAGEYMPYGQAAAEAPPMSEAPPEFFGGGQPPTEPAASSSQPEESSPQPEEDSSPEAQVAALVNKARAEAGLPPLALDGELMVLARIKSGDMVENRYFAHESATLGDLGALLGSREIQYSTCGENIAYGQRTAEAVMEGWMNSPGHRANILNEKYTRIGVGLVESAGGVSYWTQIFTD